MGLVTKKFYIVTKKDGDPISEALGSYGSPDVYSTKKQAEKALKNNLSADRRDLYVVREVALIVWEG